MAAFASIIMISALFDNFAVMGQMLFSFGFMSVKGTLLFLLQAVTYQYLK